MNMPTLNVEARLTEIDRGEALRYLGIRGPLPVRDKRRKERVGGSEGFSADHRSRVRIPSLTR